MLTYSSIGLTKVVYAVALTDGSNWYNVRFTKFLMFYLPYLLLLGP